MYSSEDLAEAYFDVDEYSEHLKNKLKKYEELVWKTELYVKKELKNTSAFTAFKRWLIKDHSDYYPEFMQYISDVRGSQID